MALRTSAVKEKDPQTGAAVETKAAETKGVDEAAATKMLQEGGPVDEAAEAVATADQEAINLPHPKAQKPQAEAELMDTSEPGPDAEDKAVATTDKAVATTPKAAALTVFKAQNGLVALKDMVEASQFSYGDIPRVVADSGTFYGPEQLDLGKTLTVQVISHNDRWMVTPNSDDEEAGKLVRPSFDGVNLQSDIIIGEGEDAVAYTWTMQEYVDYLRENDYPKAGIKHYYDVFCLPITAAEELAIEELKLDGMVNLSLSPRSKGKFLAYIQQLPLFVKMGRVTEEYKLCMTFTAKNTKAGVNTFTLFKPSAPKPEDLEGYEPIGM